MMSGRPMNSLLVEEQYYLLLFIMEMFKVPGKKMNALSVQFRTLHKEH